MALFPPIILDKSKAIQVNSGNNNYEIDFELQSEWISGDKLYGSDNPFTGWKELTGIDTSSIPNSGDLDITNFSAGTAGSWTHLYLKHVRGSEEAVSDPVIRYFVRPENINIQCNKNVVSSNSYTLAVDTDLTIKANATCTGDIVTHCIMTLEGYEPVKVYLDNGVFTHTFKLPFSNLVKDALNLIVKAVTNHGYEWEEEIIISKDTNFLDEELELINFSTFSDYSNAISIDTQRLLGLQVQAGGSDCAIAVFGKNLLPPYDSIGTQVQNGLVYTINSDYSLSVQGKVEIDMIGYYFLKNDAPFLSVQNKFTFSTKTIGAIQRNDSSKPTGIYLSYFDAEEGKTKYFNLNNNNKTLDLSNQDISNISFYLQAYKNDIINITIYPQVELGELATAYEKTVEPKEFNLTGASRKNIQLLNDYPSSITIIDTTNNGFQTAVLEGDKFFSSKNVKLPIELEQLDNYSIFRQYIYDGAVKEEKIADDISSVQFFIDTTTQSGMPYTYRIVQGNHQAWLGPIIEIAEDAWLKNTQGQTLRVRYNVDVSALKYNYSDAITPSINAPYPFARRNAKQKYKTLTLGGLISLGDLSLEDNTLLTDSDRSTLINAKQQLDSYDYWMMAEKIYRERVLEFLYSPDIKLFMTAPEGNMLVYISNVSLTPEKSLGRAIYNISCTLTEIAPIEVDTYMQYNQ